MAGYMRLRQICLVAPHLEPVISDIAAIMGLNECYRDGNVAKYGLENALLPVDTILLEVVAPFQPGTAAGRFIDKNGGRGGYMAIFCCDDPDAYGKRANAMGVAEWQRLAAECGPEGLRSIDPLLADLVACELPVLAAQWPDDLPRSVIHADLFPDNVLMLGNRVTGLIDFYFACNDLTAYDVAVTHAAWCFADEGRQFRADLSTALLEGYESLRPLLAQERSALPLLARGAAMRCVLSRAYDWLNTPAGALVTRKDPMSPARQLQFYADPANAAVFA